MGVARRPGVDRLQALGGADEESCGVTGVAPCHGVVPPQQLGAGRAELVERTCLSEREQRRRFLGCAGLEVRRGSGQGPPGALRAIERERRRALEQRGRRRQPTPRLRPTGGTLEFGGHLLIGTRGGQGEMPGSTVRVGVGVGDGGQGTVGSPAIFGRRGGVRRRSHRGMAETYQRVHVDQPRLYGRRGVPGPDAELDGRPPYRGGVPGGLGRRHGDESPSWWGSSVRRRRKLS